MWNRKWNENSEIRDLKPNYKDLVRVIYFTSQFDPKNLTQDEFCINVVQDELEWLSRNKMWTLVPRLKDVKVINTKWAFKNNSNEFDNSTRNKVRLVVQWYTQVEGVCFD